MTAAFSLNPILDPTPSKIKIYQLIVSGADVIPADGHAGLEPADDKQLDPLPTSYLLQAEAT